MTTGVGMLLGTAAYMSPEQARGKAAGRRADIWAFGCVLYEMLTGTRAFEGESVSDTLAAVLRGQPNWGALPHETPSAIRALLRRCLERDPRERVADLGAALFVIKEQGALAAAPVRRRVSPDHAASRRRGRHGHAARRRRRGRDRCLGRNATRRPGDRHSDDRHHGWRRGTELPRGRPDLGDHARRHARGLWRDQPVAGAGARPARANSARRYRHAAYLFMSPDGQWVGFFDGNTALKKVAITGGPAVTLTPTDGTAPRGATWSEDGTIIYATQTPTTGLQRISSAGGPPTVLTTPDHAGGETDHFWPEFLPGGQAVLFTITASTGGLANAQVAVFDLRTSTYKTVLRGGHHAHYVSTGHLMYGTAGTLRAVPFDLGRLEATGPPVPILDAVPTTAEGGLEVALAATGTLVYVPGRTVGAQRSLAWVDRMGREELPGDASAGLLLSAHRAGWLARG